MSMNATPGQWQSQLDPYERQVFLDLFAKVDSDSKSIVLKDEAMAFFQKASIPSNILTEIWTAADKDAKGFLTQEEFCIALKLIACAQHGKLTASPILATAVPLPQFEGVATAKPPLPQQTRPDSRPPASQDTISQEERASYIQLFQSSQPVNGVLSADQASAIFRRSNLSPASLQQVWELADTRKSGTLNQTEFIIAMHYISGLVNGLVSQLPATLPAEIYAAATGRLTMALNRQRTTLRSPVMQHHTGPAYVGAGGNARQTDLGRSMTYTAGAGAARSPPMAFAAARGGNNNNELQISWADYTKYKGMFQQLAPDSATVSGADAVHFFRPSKLPETDLAAIWDLCDTRSIGELNENEFVVAMHLVRRRMAGIPIPTALPAAPADLVPKQPNQPNANAMADLFGMDASSQLHQQQPSPFSDTFLSAQQPPQQPPSSSSLFAPSLSLRASASTPNAPNQGSSGSQAQQTMLQDQLGSLQSQTKTENKLIDSLRSQGDALDSSVQTLQASIDKEQQQLLKLKGTAEELERQVDKRTKKKQALEQELKTLRQELKHYRKRVDHAKEDVAQLDDDIAALEKTRRNVERDVHDAKTRSQRPAATTTTTTTIENDSDSSDDELDHDVFASAPTPAKDPDLFTMIQSPSSGVASPPPMKHLQKDKKAQKDDDDDLTADIEAKFPDLSTMEHQFDTLQHAPPAATPPAITSPTKSPTSPTFASSTATTAPLFAPSSSASPSPKPKHAQSPAATNAKPSKYGFDLADFETGTSTQATGPSISSIRDDLSSLYNTTPAKKDDSNNDKDAKPADNDTDSKPSFADVFFT
ncbi:hypothetical protein BC940DRAFT_306656 [Gongronella butleri]|nr:hypothetical protein BC940DRAFT_306656 [Gongronella butleri]